MPAEQLNRPDGAAVQVALRPEKFTLSETRPEGAAHAIEVRIDNAAYLGERSHYYVRLDGKDEPVAVSAPNSGKFDGSARSSEAGPMWISWSPSSIVVLDPDE